MSLEELISNVKYNCEITNARFFNRKLSKAEEDDFFEMIYRHEKKIPPFKNVFVSENFKAKKYKLWRNLRQKKYKKVGRSREIGANKGILIFDTVKSKYQSYFLLSELEQKKEIETSRKVPIYFLGKDVAIDVYSEEARGLFRYNDNFYRILIRKTKCELELCAMLLDYEVQLRTEQTFFPEASKKPAILEFLFSDFSENLRQGFRGRVTRTRKYKDLLNKVQALTLHHEIGHLQIMEKYKKSTGGTTAGELLATTIPCEHLSTLDYIAENDETDNPVLFNLYMYFLFPSGRKDTGKEYTDLLKMLPELKDVYKKFPHKISLRKLERAINIGYARAKEILKIKS